MLTFHKIRFACLLLACIVCLPLISYGGFKQYLKGRAKPYISNVVKKWFRKDVGKDAGKEVKKEAKSEASTLQLMAARTAAKSITTNAFKASTFASLDDAIYDVTGVAVDILQTEPCREVKFKQPFGVFKSATVFATTNGFIRQIRCIHEYAKNVKPEHIVPDLGRLQKLISQKFKVTKVIDEMDAKCFLRRTLRLEDTDWYVYLYISESLTHGESNGYYIVAMTFLRD